MASVKQTAAHLFLVERRLYELLEAGVITRQAKGGYDLDQVRKEYITNLRAQAERAGRPRETEGDPDRDRLAAARADMAELALGEKRAELIPADDIAGALYMMVTNMKVRLEGIASHVAPLVMPSKPAKAEKIIRAQIHEALEELEQVKVLPGAHTQEHSPATS